MKFFYNILIILIIIIALFLIWSVLPIPGNYKLLIVQSGSMQPEIKNGSIVVVKPVDDYKIGDVVTFIGRDAPLQYGGQARRVSVTHRIHDMRVQEGVPIYITQGDANDAPDKKEVLPDEIIGKVLFDLPYLGYVIDFTKKPVGFMLIILIPAAMIIGEEIRKIKKEIKRTN